MSPLLPERVGVSPTAELWQVSGQHRFVGLYRDCERDWAHIVQGGDGIRRQMPGRQEVKRLNQTNRRRRIHDLSPRMRDLQSQGGL
jgi:hypothetical protein